MSLSPVELFPGRAPRIRPAAGPSPFKSMVCGVDASHGGSRRAAIILGSTASAAFHGESLGSVSERVAHRARCSVLVVRPEAR